MTIEKPPAAFGELGTGTKGEITSGEEGTHGIVGLSGDIHLTMAQELSRAALKYVYEREITRVVVDFTKATFLDERLQGVLVKIYGKARNELKEMSLRNVGPIESSTIRQLLAFSHLDGRFVLEGEDPPEVIDRKLALMRQKPPNFGPEHT